jgi:hypothetical protein
MMMCSLERRDEHFRGTCWYHLPSSVLRITAAGSSETLILIYQNTRRHTPEVSAVKTTNLNFHFEFIIFSLYFCVCYIIGIATRQQAGRPRNRGSIPGRGQEILLFSLAFTPAPSPLSVLYNAYMGLSTRR